MMSNTFDRKSLVRTSFVAIFRAGVKTAFSFLIGSSELRTPLETTLPVAIRALAAIEPNLKAPVHMDRLFLPSVSGDGIGMGSPPMSRDCSFMLSSFWKFMVSRTVPTSEDRSLSYVRPCDSMILFERAFRLTFIMVDFMSL